MLEAAKITLTAELDKTWSKRLKDMSSSLRAELEKQHKETSDSAVAELSALKDSVLKDESEKWKHQKSQLLSQVIKHSNTTHTILYFHILGINS